LKSFLFSQSSRVISVLDVPADSLMFLEIRNACAKSCQNPRYRSSMGRAAPAIPFDPDLEFRPVGCRVPEVTGSDQCPVGETTTTHCVVGPLCGSGRARTRTHLRFTQLGTICSAVCFRFRLSHLLLPPTPLTSPDPFSGSKSRALCTRNPEASAAHLCRSV